MTMRDKVVIIGAGLGGLECGYILARHGFDVTVLEQSQYIGGCIQSFMRGSTIFDTGLHYVGGLAEGEPLNRIFRYFGLMDLPWKQLDRDCFDQVSIGEKSYCFPSGFMEFEKYVSDCFPGEKDGVHRYAELLRSVSEHIFDIFSPDRDSSESFHTPLLQTSAYGFLNSTFSDPELRKMLCGTSIRMELDAESLPLYEFAQINSSFIGSAWRLSGGGSRIAESLAAGIESMGGRVRTSARVTALSNHDGRIASVQVNGEEIIQSDWVVSDIHPAATLSLLSGGIRKLYRDRIVSLPNSFGIFTANIALKPGALRYVNRNIYIHKADSDPWHPVPGRTDSVMVHWYMDSDGDCSSMDLMTPMWWHEVERWSGFPPGRRGEDYVEFKRRKTGECLDLAELQVPGLKDAVERIYTSTPLSYSSYLLDPEGTAYGIKKDWRRPVSSVISPRTPVSNLLLTGQNLNLHGLLGVSVTSFLTCSCLLGQGFARADLAL